MSHVRITGESGIPLVGSLYFGIIDRGTSLLQVRPSCGCNLNCPFCSVDAGPATRTRATSYEVEIEGTARSSGGDCPFKGAGVECHIDSPGEPPMYHSSGTRRGPPADRLRERHLAPDQRDAPGRCEDRALQSAGLDRINLSIHALDPEMVKTLAGVDWFDTEKLKMAAEAVARSEIDLLNRVLHPGINDAEIPKLIRYAQEIGAANASPRSGSRSSSATSTAGNTRRG